MRRITAAALAALAIASPASVSAWEPAAEAALFFERGHYWIELRIEAFGTGGDTIAPARDDFEIREEGGEPFRPSRVELLRDGDGLYAVLSSGRLRGKRCYLVDCAVAPDDMRTVGPVCDPAGREPAERRGAAGFFARSIAPAFSLSGEEYRLNRLSIDYDFTPEKATASIDVAPVFEAAMFRFAPFFSSGETTYRPGSEGESSVSRRRAGAAAGAGGWTGPVRIAVEAELAEEHESSSSVPGTSTALSTTSRALLRVRLDNLFDRINKHGASVLKGIDAGSGWAWYTAPGRPGLDRLDLSAPLVTGRVTWTLLSVLQLSYDVEACRPDGAGEWTAVHRVRARLLLRQALAPPGGRSYHPDLELSIDAGRRLPRLEREESVSLGFTFDLFPW